MGQLPPPMTPERLPDPRDVPTRFEGYPPQFDEIPPKYDWRDFLSDLFCLGWLTKRGVLRRDAKPYDYSKWGKKPSAPPDFKLPKPVNIPQPPNVGTSAVIPGGLPVMVSLPELVRQGIITADEAREKMGLGPIDGEFEEVEQVESEKRQSFEKPKRAIEVE